MNGLLVRFVLVLIGGKSGLVRACAAQRGARYDKNLPPYDRLLNRVTSAKELCSPSAFEELSLEKESVRIWVSGRKGTCHRFPERFVLRGAL